MRHEHWRVRAVWMAFLLLLAVGSSTALADWDDSMPFKWVQHPDLSPMGIDINCMEPYVLADDFKCTVTGPITNIHIWGSWLYDYIPFGEWPEGLMFRLSIHKDIPADENPDGYSIPGEVVWFREFAPGDFVARPYAEGIEEGWMDPPDGYIFPADWTCWQYNFYINADEAFVQEGTESNPIIYWLEVQAMPEDQEARFGWKTSEEHWNDNAVWGMGVAPHPGPWQELFYPLGHEMHGMDIDLAFVIGGEDLPVPMDFGDAPDPTYPTLLASNGASHVIWPGYYLGAGVDSEPDGQPDPAAMGDDLLDGNDDEDGVIMPTAMYLGTSYGITVTASGSGMLDAWIDWNCDGDWADPGEQIFNTQVLSPGPNNLTVTVPATATVGQSFARYRYSITGGFPFYGPADVGEVEDYELFIREDQTEYKWLQNPDLSIMGIDVNASTHYDGRDFILADDFECTMSGPITQVYVWGSWLHDYLPLGDPHQVGFTLSFHGDIPAEDNPDGYSMPSEPLWYRHFQPGEFAAIPWAENIEEGWMDPPEHYEFPADWTCWLYIFDIPADEAFRQYGTPDNPIVYWLDVDAQPMDMEAMFGWKTSETHWNDDAVWGTGDEPYPGPWWELIYPPGHEMFGQSIDLAFALIGEDEPVELDFGDAPDPTYPTWLASDGARHVITSSLFLGAGVDADPDGQPDPMAMGDDLLDGNDDEDGVSIPNMMFLGQTYTITVNSNMGGMLDGWIDWNADGDWADPGEQLFAASLSLVVGANSFNVTVPTTAPAGALSFARFRVSWNGGLGYSGLAYDGEVEDYAIEFQEEVTDYKWYQRPDLDETGIDVNCSEPFVLADDFLCSQPGPLRMVTVWGSWLNDYLPFGGDPTAVAFTLSIHADIPAEDNPDGYSMPGEVLWFRDFMPGEFMVDLFADGILEGWMTPPDDYIFPGDTQCWRYIFDLMPEETFFQHGTEEQPIVYWLDVQAHQLDPDAWFGWKTSLDHWNDDATWGMGLEPYPGPWGELRYPPEHPLHPESLDLAFMIKGDYQPVDLDFGDAPDPTYPTLRSSNGARHVIIPGIFLGGMIDAEIDGQPHPSALGDDLAGLPDEDGVIFTDLLRPGGTTSIDVIASIPGYLDGWIDFNGDGDWDEADERIFTAQPLIGGVNPLSFTLPANGLVGHMTFARFRYHTYAGPLNFVGLAGDGEVEDYEVYIEDDLTASPEEMAPSSFGLHQNAPNPFNPQTTIRYDVKIGGGDVALQIFNVEGRLVRVLVDSHQSEGRYAKIWDGRDDRNRSMPSGIYFYRLQAPGFEKTRKMLLLQ